MEQEARSGCPINAAVEAFGDSWSLLVLRDVTFGNRRYFRELLAGPRRDRLQHPGRPAQAAGERRSPDTRGCGAGAPGGLQPDRGVHPARAGLRAARRVGSATPPDYEAAAGAAEVLAAGGPPLWAELMAELRAIHLGTAAPERTSPSVIERLAEAYAAAS